MVTMSPKTRRAHLRPDGQVQQGEKDGFHTRHSRSRGRRHATLPTPRIQREN